MSDQPKELGKRLLERYEALKAIRAPWESLWDDIAKYVFPRRVPGMNGSAASPTQSNEGQMFDSTAVQANLTLANGQLAWMSPLESQWFTFEQPVKKPMAAYLKKEGQPATGAAEPENDDVKLWLSGATKIAREELATSRFYTEVHEFYLDRGAFGIACLYVEPGRKNTFNVEVWPVGSFVVDEDDEGNVDTVMRCFKLTARQAIQKFGEENVSPKIKKLVKDGKGHEKREYIHAIYPREDAERDKAKLDSPNMPIASVYIEKDGCHICRVSGYEEMPAFVSRYLEWGSATGWLYGWSPAFAALPECRQVNFLQEMMDALAEKHAFPPVLAPAELEGEIDPNAMGVTYFSKELAAGGSMPKEWMTAGKYDIGLDRIKERQKAINQLFHVDLFQMFAALNKQMTAREVAERSQEKLIQFSPTFSRLTTELFNPLLERVFGILVRSGMLGDSTEIPAALVERTGKTTGNIPVPKIRYASRIALALASLPSIGYARTLERLVGVAQIAPYVLDNFDFDALERAAALADGVDASALVPIATRDEIRKNRAAAQAQQEQMQQAAGMADAVGKMGKIPANSPVGAQLEQAMRQAA